MEYDDGRPSPSSRTPKPTGPRRRVACKACRAAKMRCEPPLSGWSRGACRRCIRLSQGCSLDVGSALSAESDRAYGWKDSPAADFESRARSSGKFSQRQSLGASTRYLYDGGALSSGRDRIGDSSLPLGTATRRNEQSTSTGRLLHTPLSSSTESSTYSPAQLFDIQPDPFATVKETALTHHFTSEASDIVPGQGRARPSLANASGRPNAIDTGTHPNSSGGATSSANALSGCKDIEQRISAASGGLLTLDLATRLFDAYARKYAHFMPLLHPRIHTPYKTLVRSEVLFLIVCAIAGFRELDSESLSDQLWKRVECKLMPLITGGQKDIELVQSLCLLALWTRPSSDFDRSKAAQYCSMACRIASQMHLEQCWDLTSTSGLWQEDALEVMNRQRTYVVVSAAGRSLGQPGAGNFRIGQEDDLLIRGKRWAVQPFSEAYDVMVVAIFDLFRRSSTHAEWLRFLAATMQSDSEDTLQAVLNAVEKGHADLDGWETEWAHIGWSRASAALTRDGDTSEQPLNLVNWPKLVKACECCRVAYRLAYCRLVLNVSALRAFAACNKMASSTSYFLQCFESAAAILEQVQGSMKAVAQHGPDVQYMMIIHACIVLIRLCRHSMCTAERVQRALLLMKGAYEVFQSQDAMQNNFSARYALLLGRLLKSFELDSEGEPSQPTATGHGESRGSRQQSKKLSDTARIDNPDSSASVRTETETLHTDITAAQYSSLFGANNDERLDFDMILNDTSIFSDLYLPTA